MYGPWGDSGASRRLVSVVWALHRVNFSECASMLFDEVGRTAVRRSLLAPIPRYAPVHSVVCVEFVGRSVSQEGVCVLWRSQCGCVRMAWGVNPRVTYR